MPDMVTRPAGIIIAGLSDGLLNNGMASGKKDEMIAMVFTNKDLVVDLAELLMM